MNSKLFSGHANPFGGLSNEDELVKIYPVEFENRHNKWSEYAMEIFFNGANIANWKWKTGDELVRKQQLSCFRGLISSFIIKHEDKEAVAGWMLSEMLEEVPEYLPNSNKKGGE